MEDGRLYTPSGSRVVDSAAGLAWLWRLGPVLSAPDVRAVGMGTADEASELHGLVEAGRLAGAVVFAPGPGPVDSHLPIRRRVSGGAAFGPGALLEGDFTVLDGGNPVVRSSLGVHAAVVGGRTLVLAAEPATAWSVLRQFWVLEALAGFLAERLERPMVLLPAVGCVRLDDAPGTAQHQAEGRAHSDRRQVRRIQALTRAYGGRGAVLNMAVAARSLGEDRRTDIPLEQHWPRAVAAIAVGVRAGIFEPVGHGYLHLDREAFDRGEIEPREFASLGEDDAGRLIDASITWQRDVLGRHPATFVAPAWGYSDGTFAALEARRLPAWLRPGVGPLRDGGAVHETIDSAMRGLRGVKLGTLASLARTGLPPTPVFHGRLFDLRVQQLRASSDLVTAARLLARRDIFRLPSLPGLRWVGASELIRLLDAHGSIVVRGAEVDLTEAPHARLLGPGGATQHLTGPRLSVQPL